MNKFALVRLINMEMDPYFLVEFLLVFAVFIVDYSLIYLSGIQPGNTTPDIYGFTGSILRSIYFPYILILSLNVFMVTTFIENGKILTFVSFGYSARRVIASMFLWAVFYSTALVTAVFTVNVYLFTFTVSILSLVEIAYFVLSLSIFVTGAGFLIAAAVGNSVVSTGTLVAFFIFIAPSMFGTGAESDFFQYIFVGFSSIGLFDPFSRVFIVGGAFELIFGLALFLSSLIVIERRSLRATRK